MKFPYKVYKDGILYLAGQDAPEDNEVVKEEKEVEVEPEVQEEVEEQAEETEQNEEVKEEHTRTKTEVNRMNTVGLHELAKEIGIEDEENKSGAQLKAEIIEKLGL